MPNLNVVSGLCPLCGYEFGNCTCGWSPEEMAALQNPPEVWGCGDCWETDCATEEGCIRCGTRNTAKQ